ncbi:MAG: hypothetical protein BWK80_46875, partial [Desulfobacteraceae bacterium IS3]
AGNLSGAVEHVRNINSRKLAEKKLSSANKAIMDSIRYAELIQKSILPNTDEVKIAMPESFFLWLPRDIVGGDIFFVHFFNNGFVIAVIDCTGHGVPGAFMSMIAFSALKRIVSDGNCYDPAEILKRMNKIVKTSLRQDTEHALSDDGLDAAVCSVKFHISADPSPCPLPEGEREKTPHPGPLPEGERETAETDRGILTFAGARVPLYYFKNGEIIHIKGDRANIGYRRSDMNYEFTDHVITIEKGMCFYLATDGFADQIGGKNKVKFGTKRFKNLLKEIGGESFEKQRNILVQEFAEYAGENERLDDITVAGFGFQHLRSLTK